MATQDARRGLEDEDASTLRLGKDFQDAPCLLNAEVALILENKLQNSSAGAQQKSDFLKAYEYVNRVKMYRDREAVQHVRNELEKRDYHDFERVQLGNLCPDDAEEAKTLIPSLRMPERNIESGTLTDTLNQIAKHRLLN